MDELELRVRLAIGLVVALFLIYVAIWVCIFFHICNDVEENEEEYRAAANAGVEEGNGIPIVQIHDLGLEDGKEGEDVYL